MESNFFKDCETLDEARKLYYKLAMEHHPDKGGDEETFKQLANEFESFRPGKKKYENEMEDWSSEIFAHIIDQLFNIPDLSIEIVGSWIWISGDTKPHKEQIKDIEVGEFYKRGFSRSKNMWYFSPKGYRKKSKKDLSMDDIRSFYGSESVKNNSKSRKKKELEEA